MTAEDHSDASTVAAASASASGGESEGAADSNTVTDRNKSVGACMISGVKPVNAMNGTTSGMPPPTFTSPAKVSSYARMIRSLSCLVLVWH
jgi:hypothetical protein